MSRIGYCIFINTTIEGNTPLIRDENDFPFVFKSKNEAEREIAETQMQRLQEFLDGDREFDDAAEIEEYVEKVTVRKNGAVIDFSGREHSTGRLTQEPNRSI